MLNVTVSNFRGIRTAKLHCSRIALLAGQNEQGKSSILDAIRSVLDGTARPYGLTKDEVATELLYGDSDQACVTLLESRDGHDDRGSEMKWPSGDISTMGAPFRATPFATGSVRFTSLPDQEKAKVLAQYLKTEPTETEFLKGTEAVGLDPTELAQAWKDIVALGWDGAHQKHKTMATEAKGAWKAITGAQYGTSVGGNWRPKNWGPDHEAMTDAELVELLAEDTKALEDEIGTVAINADEKGRLQAAVNNLPKLTELLTTREADGKRAKTILDKAEADLKAIPVLPKDKWPTCPHCNEPVQIMGTETLRKAPKPLSEKERVALTDKIHAAEDVHKKALAAYDELRVAYQTVQGDIKTAQAAKEQLEGAGPDGPKVNMDELRTNLANTQSVINFKKKIRDALKQHSAIIARLDLVEALSPEGLRQVKLATKIDEFNDRLGALCDVAGWTKVAVDGNGVVTLNGVRYPMCSGSGKARCDVTLQVAFGIMDGSEVLLVDEADILDGKGRNGLFSLLAHTGLYAIVGMMMTKSAQAPDLAAAELGATWWIQDAAAVPLEQIKAKAA